MRKRKGRQPAAFFVFVHVVSVLYGKMPGLQNDQFAQILLFKTVNLLVELVHLARPVHGAELWSAHGAEGGFLVVVIGKRLVVHGAGGFGIEREGELLLPVEGVPGVADGVVAVLR